MVIVVKGISGSGKSTLARSVAAGYGSVVDAVRAPDGRLLAAVLTHPSGGCPLMLIGSYDRVGGGCDALRQIDGGLPRIAHLALAGARRGWNVLAEGNALSFDVEITGTIVRSADTRIVALAADLPSCHRALIRRRRLGRAQARRLQPLLQQESIRFEEALLRLPEDARVHRATAVEARPVIADWLGIGDGPGAAFVGEQIPVIAQTLPECGGI